MCGLDWTSGACCLFASFCLIIYASADMLEVAVERETEGDVFLADMGQGFGFRPGTFDAAIRYRSSFAHECSVAHELFSISALQWLCYADRKDHVSYKRLTSFFHSLYRVLRRGGRLVIIRSIKTCSVFTKTN